MLSDAVKRLLCTSPHTSLSVDRGDAVYIIGRMLYDGEAIVIKNLGERILEFKMTISSSDHVLTVETTEDCDFDLMLQIVGARLVGDLESFIRKLAELN